MNRRHFLKILGAGVATVAAAPLLAPRTAPLFVPSDRLDFGVPSGRLVEATELPPPSELRDSVLIHTSGLRWMDTTPEATIPMLMLDDNYSYEYGQAFAENRIPSGATLMVDRATAERWIAHGVAAPAPSAPADLQHRAAARLTEKEHVRLTAKQQPTPTSTRTWIENTRLPLPPVTRAIFVNGDAPDITAGPLSWSGETWWSGSRPDPFERMIVRATAKLKRDQAAAEKWPD